MKKNSFLLLGYVGFIVAAIFVTTGLIHKPTQSRTHATASTTLSFSSVNPVNTGQTFSLSMQLNPGNNYVSYVQAVIDYDSTYIKPASMPITPGTIPGTNPPQPFGIFDGPTNTCNG